MLYRVFIVALPVIMLSVPSFSEAPVSYESQIRPLLSGACFQCHGPDENARKGKLRLDVALDDPESKIIVPGQPDASELFHRITATDPQDRMPPAEVGDALTPEQVALIRAWITEGAIRTEHWAFEAPMPQPVPSVENTAWPRNAIDNFVLARLDGTGLRPAPEADRLTLLRRLSLDLTGLPPTLDEIDRVMADASSGWYDAAVERLLASPHYGEHWARHWLDAAQYADSDGFEKDKPRQVWAWRDWVINAFNDDMPYDQFVVEQIAGDQLSHPTQDQRVATGFLRNSMINEEGGIDPEQFRMEAQFNRMDLVGRAVLGLTVACAQCHTHKYDPLTHTEYYQMMAFLNNSYEACITVYSDAEKAQRERLLALINEVEDDIKKERPAWRDDMMAWVAEARQEAQPAWEVLEFTMDDSSAGGQKCLPVGDGSYLAQGYAPTRNWPKMTAKSGLEKITAIRLELLTDPNLPRMGPGRSVYGACALSEMEMRTVTDDLPIAQYDKWTPVKLASAVASVNPPRRVLGVEFPDQGDKVRYTGPIDMAIDGDGDTAWTTDIDPGRRNQPHEAIFTLAEPVAVTAETTLAVRMGQLHGGWNSDDNQTNNLGRFRISVTNGEAVPNTVLPPRIAELLAKETWTEAEEQEIFSHWRTTIPELARANQRIDGLWQATPDGATQLALEEQDETRTTHRLARGDFLQPKEAVAPGVPAFLNGLNVEGAPDRLDFAKWLVSPDAPTTARAYVNRVWQRYFGTGIVATTADFGMQGDPPSHPELLDWIAVEFMASGWKVKDLHRRIVTSATYRQAATASPEQIERDPENRLLARGARFRVEGETVRDIALAASGLLNPEVGGPSVNPPAPDFLFLPPASYGPKTWDTDEGPDAYRRALYTFRFRSVPYPALQVFDTPAGDAPCTGRDRSNSPLQALTLLNEPVFNTAAIHLAESTLADGGDDDRSRIDYAFRRCVTRAPGDGEVDTLLAFLDTQRARITEGSLDPKAIVDKEIVDVDPASLAAWALTARVILNLDETIVRQ